eukprot:UN31338
MYASYQSQNCEVVFINKQPGLIKALLGLLGIPEKVNFVSSLIPITTDWDTSNQALKDLCVDLLGPSAGSRRQIALCSLRILINLSHTNKNQQVMIDNPHLTTSFLKKIIDCDDLAMKVGCMKVLANISWRWALKQKNVPILLEVLEDGLSKFSFDDQYSDEPAFADATLKTLSGLAANPTNRAILVNSLSKAV